MVCQFPKVVVLRGYATAVRVINFVQPVYGNLVNCIGWRDVGCWGGGHALRSVMEHPTRQRCSRLQGDVTVEMVMNAWGKALYTQDAVGAAARMGTPLTVEEAAGLLHSCSPAALRHILEPVESLAVPLDLFLKAALHTEGRENASLEVLSFWG